MYPCVCVVVQVVPLNQAREFSHNRKAIYVFKVNWSNLIFHKCNPYFCVTGECWFTAASLLLLHVSETSHQFWNAVRNLCFKLKFSWGGIITPTDTWRSFLQKLEWQSLSIDLLPHPDMFKDERLMSPGMENSSLDNDGAKRLFFGGERFLDSISGAANVTSISLSHFHHSFVLL